MFKKSGKAVATNPYKLVERFAHYPRIFNNVVEFYATRGKNNEFSIVFTPLHPTDLPTVNYLFETTVTGRLIHTIHKVYYYYYEYLKYINNNSWKGTK